MKTAIAVAAVLAALALGSAARAQTVTDPFWFGPWPRVGIARATPTATNRVGGTVTAVSPRKRSLVVFDDESGATFPIALERDTRVIGERGQRVGIDQLKPGEQVQTDFDLQGGRLVADEIRIAAPPGEPAPARP